MRIGLLFLAVIVTVNVDEAHGAPPVVTLTHADASIVFQTSHRGMIACDGSRYVIDKVKQTLDDELQWAHTAEQLTVIGREDVHYHVVLIQEISRLVLMERATAARGRAKHDMQRIPLMPRHLPAADTREFPWPI
jgi:hypothetical protein